MSTAKVRGAPRGVSHRLTAALEQFPLEVFKALQPMELQLNCYSPGNKGFEKENVGGSLERTGRVSLKESPARRLHRKASRHREELATELMVFQATYSPRSAASLNEAEEVPRKRSLKDIIRPMMIQSRVVKRFAARLSERKILEEQERQLSALGQQSAAKKKLEIRCPSPDSDPDPSNKHPEWTTPRKTPHNLGIPTEILEKMQEPRKEDILRTAIEARPDAPELKDDGFKFGDVLFKRLLQAVLPPGQKPPKWNHDRSFSPTTREPTLTSRNWSQGAEHSSAREGRDRHLTSGSGLGSRPSTVGHAPQARSPDLLPSMTTLAKDRGNLIKGLSACIGKIDRCNLSPPPMNAYAMQLSERIEQMMGTEAAPRKRVNFPQNEVPML